MNPSNSAAWLIVAMVAVTLALQPSCALPPPEVTQPNQAPVIERVNYAKDTLSNMEVQIDCAAKDADGDNLTYKWTAEAGEINGTGNSILWMPPGKMGTYPITLAVTDGKGGVATENISVRVLTNADGTATPMLELKLKMGDTESSTVYKQRIRNWFEMEIICLVEGAGGAADLTYVWSATGGEMRGKGLEEGKANKIRWKAPGIKGDYTVSVGVRDAHGSEVQGHVIITVFCCGDS